MENTIHYSKALVDGTIDEFEKFERLLDEIEQRYPDEKNPVTVGLMMTMAIINSLWECLGDDLFCRNLKDIPDTKESLVDLLDEIAAKMNTRGYTITFDGLKKELLEAAE